ncbi:hypothetical protein BDN71DRAFT_1437564 [Pleurotus eryngii]|uniref:Integrase zinc-binding domain-containing protein n=1 Tax=Pleurotus eryngii TaxID=5323 RepID=A0A9P6A8H7_PLEER|nr:hypothetical protein BDN71DRAFT_1437564 [Pleurotus eryngii]
MTRNAQPKPYSRPSNTDSAHPNSPVEYLRQIASDCQHQGAGNPDYAQYKQAEADYAQALKPNRRAKALIDQTTFEDIWAVLHGLDRRTPQFRFWVRKMFTLGPPPEDLPGLPFHPDSPDLVVLHEGRPIALQEHIYDILCYCHELSGHSGRDRTCTITRSRYSWIPKDLIARFIRHCPTCGTKKGCSTNVAFSSAIGVVGQREYNGGLSQLKERLSHIAEEQAEDTSDGPITSSEDSDLSRRYSTTSSSSSTSTTAVESFPLHSGPPILRLAATGTCSEPLAPEVHDRFMVKSESAFDTFSLPMSRFSSSTASSSSACSTPMSREVSLYGGLPNGWQYVSEYHDAYNKFAENKLRRLPREAERLARREIQLHPRVPSVAPLGAAIFSDVDVDENDLVILPPIDEPPKQPSDLPGELRELRSLRPTSPQIDPQLMEIHVHNKSDPRYVSFCDMDNNAGPAWSDSGCYVVHDPSLDLLGATVHAH